jgi:membrane protease subunit HflK
MKEFVIDISRVRRLSLPRLSPKAGARLAAAAIVLALVWSAMYQVGPDEIGVVRRFGRYVRASQSGLRLKLPFVETVTTVPVQRQLRQEFGFRTTADRKQTQRFLEESTMLTGDLNVAVVEWIVQYRIADPYRFLFRVGNSEKVFRDLTAAVMESVVGDRTLTEVVTVGRQDVEAAVQQTLQQAVDRYDMGLRVDQVVLQGVNPPDPVKPSWDEVNQAQQQRDRLINEARAQYNTVVPKARGEAAQAILAADGYAIDRVNRAEGDASRFLQADEAYQKAPDVTRRRLQLETLGRVLPRVGGKVVLDKDARGVLPLLPLDRFTAGVAAAAAPSAAAKPAPAPAASANGGSR